MWAGWNETLRMKFSNDRSLMASQEERSSEEGEGLEEALLFQNLGSGWSPATWGWGAATAGTWTLVASAWETEAQVAEVAISTQSSNSCSFV